MAVFLPAPSRAKELAKRVVCSSQCRQIGVAISAYATDYEGTLPYYGGTEVKDESHPYAVYRGDKPEYSNAAGKFIPMKLACLFATKVITEPKLFYCPSNIDPWAKYKSYIEPPPWGTLPQEYNTISGSNQWVRVGYTYYPVDPTVRKDIVGGTMVPKYTARKFDKIDTRMPYMTDILHSKAKISHRRQKNYGINALFKDGHVVFCNDEEVFNNQYWDHWDPPDGGDPAAGIDFRYLYYNIFKMVEP